MSPVELRSPGTPARTTTIERVLLACGIVSALLYLVMNIVVPAHYPGYSIASQTVSELSAIDAPTQSLWAIPGTFYTLLAIAFGFGVWLAGRRNQPLRVAGTMLIIYAMLGVVWPFAPMHQRTVLASGGGTLSDTVHLILSAVTVLLMLTAIGFAAGALGKWFRRYSIATMITLLVFGALTGMNASRVGANLPTPSVGIWERIDIGIFLLWVIVVAIVLMRRPVADTRAPAVQPSAIRIGGEVAPGFEEVRTEFERNFAERGELGAGVAAYWHGEKVVDLWGGRRSPDSDAPWNSDTMVVAMSSTKGMAAMTLAVANARGWIDYDVPVARYWPEFAQNGKSAITVRQLLAHEAGLVLLDEDLTIARMGDLDDVAQLLARQAPAWTPGSCHGYHVMSLGLYMQELIRRVDPRHRTLGRFFHDEIAVPLGIEFYIGLPRDMREERIARVRTLSIPRAVLGIRKTPLPMVRKMLARHSMLRGAFLLSDLDWNNRRMLEIELPAGNGVGTARAMARAYSAFAEGGGELGITLKTLASMVAPPDSMHPVDAVLGVPSYFSLGYLRPGPELSFGSSPRAFGAPGAGGSFAFADPDAHLGYAYLMNKLDFYLADDPREKALRDAIYRAIARLGDQPALREVRTTLIPQKAAAAPPVPAFAN